MEPKIYLGIVYIQWRIHEEGLVGSSFPELAAYK
jgi:hypothetical protein